MAAPAVSPNPGRMLRGAVHGTGDGRCHRSTVQPTLTVAVANQSAALGRVRAGSSSPINSTLPLAHALDCARGDACLDAQLSKAQRVEGRLRRGAPGLPNCEALPQASSTAATVSCQPKDFPKGPSQRDLPKGPSQRDFPKDFPKGLPKGTSQRVIPACPSRSLPFAPFLPPTPHLLCRLEHDAVACRQRWGHLPSQHKQREVLEGEDNGRKLRQEDETQACARVDGEGQQACVCAHGKHHIATQLGQRSMRAVAAHGITAGTSCVAQHGRGHPRTHGMICPTTPIGSTRV